jgi:hypothetical protein
MRALAVAIVLTALGSNVATQERPAVTSLRIPREMHFREPRDPCAVPTMARVLSSALGVPFGIEGLPELCDHRDYTGERIPVKGLTVAEVLDRITAIDNRYRWKEMDGVVVVRPAAAWDDGNHFLHSTVPSFVHEDLNIRAAAQLIAQMLGHFPPVRPEVFARSLDYQRQSSTDAADRFAVRLPDTSARLDVLNGITRGQGAMYWHIDYCQNADERRGVRVTLMRFTSGLSGPGYTGACRPTTP